MGVLLLNVTFEPLRIIPLKRALNLLLDGKAEVLEEGDRFACSQFLKIKRPLVLRLLYLAPVPFRAKFPLTRRNLAARDMGKCGYCGNSGSTIDHVVPKSRGGKHVWENVVLACTKCNAKKADKTLAAIGWQLRVTPKAPHGLVWFLVGYEVHESWEPYLQAA